MTEESGTKGLRSGIHTRMVSNDVGEKCTPNQAPMVDDRGASLVPRSGVVAVRDPGAIEAQVRHLMAQHAAIKPRGFDSRRARELLHRQIDTALDELTEVRLLRDVPSGRSEV